MVDLPNKGSKGARRFTASAAIFAGSIGFVSGFGLFSAIGFAQSYEDQYDCSEFGSSHWPTASAGYYISVECAKIASELGAGGQVDVYVSTDLAGNTLTSWEQVLFGQEHLIVDAIQGARSEFERQNRRHRDANLMYLNSHYAGSMLTKSPEALGVTFVDRGTCPIVFPSTAIPGLSQGPYPFNDLQFTLVHELMHNAALWIMPRCPIKCLI